MSEAAPISLQKLVKKYGTQTAVNEVTLEMLPGEILGLLGPNGAGKTSIISILVTLENPTAGSASIFDFDVTQQARQAKAITGFVPQEIINHGYFDVTEILEFHSGYFGLYKNRERIDYLLEKLGLWEQRHKKVKQLSGGMKRRLLIAKALVHNPRLLLLDEPTAGVDIELRESLWKFVAELKSQGLSILLTTHYLEEAQQLCDRIGVMQKGILKTLGPTENLIKNLTKREIVLVFKAQPPAEIQHPFLTTRTDRELVFQVPTSHGFGDLISELGIDVRLLRDVQIHEGNLEDAIREVLGR